MNSAELVDMAGSDEILVVVESLKSGLLAKATNGDFDQAEYKRLRKIVLGFPNISHLLPAYLKSNRTPSEFRTWIQSKASSYAERRALINESLNPIIELIEYETSEGSLEFKRQYEEKELIGFGGFGSVFRFEHKLLKLPFAVKIFSPSFYKGGDKELERFFQEARMLFQLTHPNIIKVYDAGLIGNRPFIRMEYFQGKNLNQILNDYGVQSPLTTLILIMSIVDGLEFAHEQIGIIHRDLKPSNIMAAKPNQFRIIDFGMGIYIENDLHSRITKTGESAVNGLYNAPELVKDPKMIDKRSDIFSIGSIWYTILTGQPPAGTNVMQELKSIKGINDDYLECINKCLSNYHERYPSCVDLKIQLNELYKSTKPQN